MENSITTFGLSFIELERREQKMKFNDFMNDLFITLGSFLFLIYILLSASTIH